MSMTDYNIQTIGVEAHKADIICDIDGTLMNVEDRLALAIEKKRPEDKKMNWDVFLDPAVMSLYDRPNWDVVFLIKKLMATGSTIIFTSARNERHRDVSKKQIVHGCNISMAVTTYSNKGNRLYLRRDGDFRGDEITKKEIFEKILTDGFRPQLAFDDRDQVVSMWRSIGLPCFQVREGKF
jgi:hypothetical protein